MGLDFTNASRNPANDTFYPSEQKIHPFQRSRSSTPAIDDRKNVHDLHRDAKAAIVDCIACMKLPSGRNLTFSDESHAIGAAIAGQGVALVDLPLVEQALRDGTLVAPFGAVLHRFSFWLVYPDAQCEPVTSRRRTVSHSSIV
jgi:DNA-binding transcriptional LysR family regulator